MAMVKVSKESLDCIIEMAGYGISYWAVSATQDDEARTYTIIPDEHPTDEERTPIVVTYDDIVQAFWNLAAFNQELVGPTVHSYIMRAVLDGMDEGKGDIDAGHIDADAADVIIQIAAFKELVFG